MSVLTLFVMFGVHQENACGSVLLGASRRNKLY
jgi:hypothetical protein